jgi:hypothetical protein
MFFVSIEQNVIDFQTHEFRSRSLLNVPNWVVLRIPTGFLFCDHRFAVHGTIENPRTKGVLNRLGPPCVFGDPNWNEVSAAFEKEAGKISKPGIRNRKFWIIEPSTRDVHPGNKAVATRRVRAKFKPKVSVFESTYSKKRSYAYCFILGGDSWKEISPRSRRDDQKIFKLGWAINCEKRLSAANKWLPDIGRAHWKVFDSFQCPDQDAAFRLEGIALEYFVSKAVHTASNTEMVCCEEGEMKAFWRQTKRV